MNFTVAVSWRTSDSVERVKLLDVFLLVMYTCDFVFPSQQFGGVMIQVTSVVMN